MDTTVAAGRFLLGLTPDALGFLASSADFWLEGRCFGSPPAPATRPSSSGPPPSLALFLRRFLSSSSRPASGCVLSTSPRPRPDLCILFSVGRPTLLRWCAFLWVKALIPSIDLFALPFLPPPFFSRYTNGLLLRVANESLILRKQTTRDQEPFSIWSEKSERNR